MLEAANREIFKKVEILEIFKNLDQFRLLRKLLLNKEQSFMIQNRDIHTIANLDSILNKQKFEV